MKRKTWIAAISAALVISCGGLMFWFNDEPEMFDFVQEQFKLYQERQEKQFGWIHNMFGGGRANRAARD